jgi:hypothetical protein
MTTSYRREETMAIANLALRFVLELIGIGSLGYWGLQTGADDPGRVILAIGGPAAMIVLWAVVVAPKATNPLTQPQRDAIGTGLLMVAALALGLAGQPAIGAIFGTAVVLNWLLLMVFGRDALTAFRPAGGR